MAGSTQSGWGSWLPRVLGYKWPLLLAEFMNVLQSNVNAIWSYIAEGELHTALHFQQLSA